MKPVKENPNSVETQGIQKSVKFGIKSSGLAHIFNVLRNQLYSDKVLAVIREYSTNAVDAHVDAGCSDRPIQVTIPNKLSPHFKVRDFGCALNDADIQDIYAFYGESTKRNTNEQTGMLGIGSKSAFAYGDNFVINSFIDGEKHIYNAFIDPSQVGQISKLSTEKTAEENGIEIVIPVKQEDIQEFTDKAQSLFRWFKVKPEIKGTADFEYEDRNVMFSGEGWKWLEPHKNYHHYRRSDQCVAVMGNIGYPISFYDLNVSDEDQSLNDLVSENLVLEVNIGDLEISASREKLQYTDFTRKNLIKRLKQVADEIAGVVAKEFDDCKTLFEAKCLHGQVFDYASGLYNLRHVLEGKMSFNGKPVKSSQFQLGDDVLVHELKKPNRGHRLRLEEKWVIDCDAKTVVVENDFPDNRGILGRLLPLAIDEDKKVYLVRFKDKKTRAKALKDSSFDAPLPRASTLEKKAIAHYYPPTGSTRTSSGNRIVSKTFLLDPKAKGWKQKNSDYWEAAEVDFDNDSGVYVAINRFEMLDKNGISTTHPQRLGKLADRFENALGKKLPPVYGIKKAQESKMVESENWIHLEDYLQDELVKAVSKSTTIQKIVDQTELGIVNGHFFISRNFREKVLPKVAMKDGDMARFCSSIREMEPTKKDTDKIADLRALAEEFHIDLNVEKIKPTVDARKTLGRLEKKYPLLELLDDWKVNRSYSTSKDVNWSAIAQYVDLVDVSNQKSVL